jgi:hypothetical protein
MNSGKQVLPKPQKKVGAPRKKGRTEEGKGGESAVPSRRTCSSGPAPPDQRKVGIGPFDNFETRRYLDMIICSN